MFLSPSNDIKIFTSQIVKSITFTLDIYAPLRLTRKRPMAECWQDKHIDDLKHKRHHFERKFCSTKNSTYKRMHRLLYKTTNAAITAKHKEYFAEKIAVSQNTLISWKLTIRLLFGPTVSLAKSVIDTSSLSQNLQTFLSIRWIKSL